MKRITLLLIETTGIQEYIFGSNNLAQNIGASELVARATSEWVADALEELRLTHNVRWNEGKGQLDIAGRSIASSEVEAEVVYAGGGNALLLFAEGKAEKAKRFARVITMRAVEEARGMSLVIGSVEFDWENDRLADKLKMLRGKVAARKLARPPDIPLVGLGVTAACDFTGLPAVGLDKDGRRISQVVAHKLRAEGKAKERLRAILPDVGKEGYRFVDDFDQFGEKGESSYIAVIHTDGNGMGKRFEAIAQKYPRPEDNADYVKALRGFSGAVNANAKVALQTTVRLLMSNWNEYGKAEKVEYLPFRPIVFGGDDVTFVCDGRLGLALAARYLQEFADETRPLPDGKPAYARAGVAVVKSHYPFSRAYELAGALCAEAKKKIDGFNLPLQTSATVMDWHFSTSGVVLELQEVRAREYVAENGHSLLMRPVWLDPDPRQSRPSKYWRSWHTFERVTREFQQGAEWAGRRNKVKALRDALRAGPTAVEQFLLNYGIGALPEIPEQPDMRTQGWQGGDCGYFDAIEATDFYMPLGKKGGMR